MPTWTPSDRVTVNSQWGIVSKPGYGDRNGQALQTKDEMSCSWNISAYTWGSNDAKNSFQFHVTTVPDHRPAGPFSSVYSHGMIGISSHMVRSTKYSWHDPVSLASDDTYRMDFSAEFANRIACLAPPAQEGRICSKSECNMAAAEHTGQECQWLEP